MRVEAIVTSNNAPVVTTRPDAPIAEVAEALAAEGSGAVVARDADGKLAGIISERDLVRGLKEHGDRLLGMRADELMTRSVVTCAPESSVENVMELMAAHNIRHIPVVDMDEVLVGVISILDIVRSRLAEVETEYGTLRDFMTTRIE
ncbi:MAG: CBS domain-containing protein [Alphaproteobacteria bacterium]